jgi:hypothetical protein
MTGMGQILPFEEGGAGRIPAEGAGAGAAPGPCAENFPKP